MVAKTSTGWASAGAAPARAPAVRVAHHERDASQLLVDLQRTGGGLALDAVLPQVVPVVGEVDHQGVVAQAEVVQLGVEAPQRAVDHRHLGGVEGPHVAPLFYGEAVAGGVLRLVHHQALVAGVVAVDVVLGRVPGLVGVPGVDPEEEGAAAVVLLQPLLGGEEGAGAEVVELGLPVVGVALVLQPGRALPAPLLRRPLQAHRAAWGPPRTRPRSGPGSSALPGSRGRSRSRSAGAWAGRRSAGCGSLRAAAPAPGRARPGAAGTTRATGNTVRPVKQSVRQGTVGNEPA